MTTPSGYWGGYFLKELTMDPLGMGWVNCFRTHNELTMDPLGILVFAPSVSCLLETNAIRRPEPLSIAEAMERLLIPAVCVREGSSPNLAEIVCRVLANDSHGIIGGHLSVDSSLQGYRIGIEARVSSEVGDEILGCLQESLE